MCNLWTGTLSLHWRHAILVLWGIASFQGATDSCVFGHLLVVKSLHIPLQAKVSDSHVVGDAFLELEIAEGSALASVRVSRSPRADALVDSAVAPEVGPASDSENCLTIAEEFCSKPCPHIELALFTKKSRVHFDLTAIEFQLDHPDESARYVIQSSLDGFGTKKPVIIPEWRIEGDAESRRCRAELPERYRNVKNVEFRIYALSASNDKGLTIDEIAVHGRVMKAPEASAIFVWIILGGAALVLGFVIFPDYRRIAAAKSIVSPMDSHVRVPDGRRASRSPWPQEVRDAVHQIIASGRSLRH